MGVGEGWCGWWGGWLRADIGAKAVLVEGPEMQQGDTTKTCLPTLSHHQPFCFFSFFWYFLDLVFGTFQFFWTPRCLAGRYKATTNHLGATKLPQQWKAKQMQSLWLYIFSSKLSEETREHCMRGTTNTCIEPPPTTLFPPSLPLLRITQPLVPSQGNWF